MTDSATLALVVEPLGAYSVHRFCDLLATITDPANLDDLIDRWFDESYTAWIDEHPTMAPEPADKARFRAVFERAQARRLVSYMAARLPVPARSPLRDFRLVEAVEAASADSWGFDR